MVTRRWLVDALAAVAVAGALCLRAAAPFEEEAAAPDWRAYALMIAIGALLLVRRRFPIGVLAASFAALVVYYMLGFGAVGATWPLAPALFNAALLGRWKVATATAGLLVIGSSVWRLVFETEGSNLLTVSDIITELVTATAVILAGAMIRNHRLLRSEVRARERAVAAERDAEARTHLYEERLRISRDVHDIVAHSLAGIALQARVAEELIGSDTEQARTSIRSVIDTTGEAMAQLRETVGSLRSAPATPPTLRDLASGIEGVDVVLEETGLPPAPDDRAEIVVRAIVREALTNVLRHSDAQNATIEVDRREDRLLLQVRDDGGPAEFTEGAGLRGMRERALELGGSFRATTTPAGFLVEVELPR